MKKTTIKIQWDTLQAINLVALKLTKNKGVKVTQDQTIRYLLEKARKYPDNALNEEKGVSKKKNE